MIDEIILQKQGGKMINLYSFNITRNLNSVITVIKTSNLTNMAGNARECLDLL